MFDHTHQVSPFQETLKLYVYERLPLYLCCRMIWLLKAIRLRFFVSSERMNMRGKSKIKFRSLESGSVLKLQEVRPERGVKSFSLKFNQEVQPFKVQSGGSMTCSMYDTVRHIPYSKYDWYRV